MLATTCHDASRDASLGGRRRASRRAHRHALLRRRPRGSSALSTASRDSPNYVGPQLDSPNLNLPPRLPAQLPARLPADADVQSLERGLVTIPHARKSMPCEQVATTIPNKNQTSSAGLWNCGHLAAELPNARVLPSSVAPLSLRPAHPRSGCNPARGSRQHARAKAQSPVASHSFAQTTLGRAIDALPSAATTDAHTRRHRSRNGRALSRPHTSAAHGRRARFGTGTRTCGAWFREDARHHASDCSVDRTWCSAVEDSRAHIHEQSRG